jgi:hypothetical protein
MRLAEILIHPRRTMRAILDGPPDRLAIPLVLAATVSVMLGDFDLRGFRGALASHRLVMILGIATAAIAACLVVAVLLFYVFGWVALWVGRLFEGTGNARSVRSAVAWGLAPVIWAVLVRFPAALMGGNANMRARTSGDAFVLDPTRFAGGCAMALVLLVIELGIFSWYVVVASSTLAEAHGFSPMRGFATLLLSVLSPLVIVLAAVLAF